MWKTHATLPRVLVLGAGGFVSGPALATLKNLGYPVEIGDYSKEKANHVGNLYNVDHHHLNISTDSREQLVRKFKDFDIVVSLVPPPLHPKVAEVALDAKTNMVTASYLSKEIASMHDRAVSSNITILNEMGLDPGIDHFFTHSMIRDINNIGGKILSYRSFVGGMAIDPSNPLGYKFSWSPQGVLKASLNQANYILNSETIHIDTLYKAAQTFTDHPWDHNLVWVPNRDVSPYKSIYHLPDSVETIIRGTLRFPEFYPSIGALHKLGLLRTDPMVSGKSVKSQLLHSLDSWYAQESEIPRNFIKWIEKDLDYVVPAPVSGSSAPNPSFMNFTADLLAEKCKYEPGQQDLILLVVEFLYQDPNSHETIKRTISLSESGVVYPETDRLTDESGKYRLSPDLYSGMARTVGITAAVGVELLCSDASPGPGVHVPESETTSHVLEFLKKAGINWEMSETKVDPLNASITDSLSSNIDKSRQSDKNIPVLDDATSSIPLNKEMLPASC